MKLYRLYTGDDGLRLVIDQARSEFKIIREIQPGEIASEGIVHRLIRTVNLVLSCGV